MSFGRSDLGNLAMLLRDAARGGDHAAVPQSRAPATCGRRPAPLDLVTEADEAAERLITRRHRPPVPGCVVVGEEATSADPQRLRLLADAELAFVVDPVDGTANFAAGLPLFGVMAAVDRPRRGRGSGDPRSGLR